MPDETWKLFQQAAVKISPIASDQLPKSCKQAKEHSLPDLPAIETLKHAITCASSKLRHPIWTNLEDAAKWQRLQAAADSRWCYQRQTLQHKTAAVF